MVLNMKTFEEIELDALKRNIPVMQKEGILFLISCLKEKMKEKQSDYF